MCQQLQWKVGPARLAFPAGAESQPCSLPPDTVYRPVCSLGERGAWHAFAMSLDKGFTVIKVLPTYMHVPDGHAGHWEPAPGARHASDWRGCGWGAAAAARRCRLPRQCPTPVPVRPPPMRCCSSIGTACASPTTSAPG